MSEGDTASVTVTFAGSGDAFGSGGRLQACIHLSAEPTQVSCSTAARPASLRWRGKGSMPTRSPPCSCRICTSTTSVGYPSSYWTASSGDEPHR